MEAPDELLLTLKLPNKSTNPSPQEVLNSSLTKNSATLCETEEYKLINKGIRTKEINKKKVISSCQLEITQWNGRSINIDTKSNFIQSLKGNFITIQEIWQRTETIKKLGNIVDFQWRETQRGGGTATLYNGQLDFKIVNKFEINKDTNALKLKIQNSCIWLINLYLNKGTSSKLQKLFGKIRSNIPHNEWANIIIIGDFNIDLNKKSGEKTLLQALAKQLGLTIMEPTVNTRKKAKLDYMIKGASIKVIEHQVISGVSDHNAVWWNLEISGLKRRQPIKIPNRKCADHIITKLLRNKRIKNSKLFIQGLHEQRRIKKRSMFTILKRRKIQLSLLFEQLIQAQDSEQAVSMVNEHWRNFWRENEETRYSKEAAKAYRNLKQILKYHLFEKRDGAIINSILKDDNEITSDSKEIEKSLLNQCKKFRWTINGPGFKKNLFLN